MSAIITLEDHGADPYDADKDHYSLMSAVECCRKLVGGSIHLGNRLYKTSGVDITGGINIIGNGYNSGFQLSASNRACLRLFSADKTFLSGFRITGTGAGLDQNGIESGYLGSDGTSQLHVSNVVCDTLGGRGFSWAYGDDIIGPQFSNCAARDCTYGYYGAMQGTLVGCSANNCTTGLWAGSGNISWTGGDIIECDLGIRVNAGGNDSHGIVNGAQINHNTIAVSIPAIINGHTFTGCHIYEGDINVTDNKTLGMVTFDGCTIDATNYNMDNCLVWFNSCRFAAGYSNTYNATNSPTVIFTNPKAIVGGLAPGWVP